MNAYMTEESATFPGKFRITFSQHDFIGPIPGGTYNAVMARLMGMTFPNFLRYVRENYNATLVGSSGYTYMYFDKKEDCDRLVKELNRRWNLMIARRKALGLDV